MNLNRQLEVIHLQLHLTDKMTRLTRTMTQKSQGIIQIVYHVYILFSEHALHWFSRVLFIATQREIMSLTELIKVENVNKYIFPKLKKNEISMFLCCKNVNILLAAKYCTLTWCNSFMQTL